MLALSENNIDTIKHVYDFIHQRFTEKEVKDSSKYEEIITAIEASFGPAIMMQYINSGFTRPEWFYPSVFLQAL